MKLIELVVFITFVILIIPSPGAEANPVPFPNSGGDPKPLDPILDISFKSEKVIYTIDNENVADVSAYYVLFNPNAVPITLNISLPFDYKVPTDLRLAANGQTIAFETVGRDSMGYSEYSYAMFHLDFTATETLTLRAVYSLEYSSYHDRPSGDLPDNGEVSHQHFWCHYIAITARYWNNSLDSAIFQFRIKKDLYGSGLEGFHVSEESGYIVATQIYYNWTPNENIDARWERLDVGGTILINWFPILIILGIISIVVVVIVIRHRRMKKQALRAWRGP